MKLTEKIAKYSRGAKFYNGRYKGCQCVITYSCEDEDRPCWYFVCDNKEDSIKYNSLWDNLKYQSCEKCHDACVKYIDEQLQTLKEQSTGNANV